MESHGVPKNWGDKSLKRAQLKREITRMRIRNPTNIGNESRSALTNPFIVLVKFGKIWIRRKNLNTRRTLRISTVERSSIWAGTKYVTNDGIDINTRIPSIWFHPEDQYPLNPNSLCLIIISMMKKIVHRASMMLTIGDLAPPSCMNSMMELSRITRRTTCSEVNMFLFFAISQLEIGTLSETKTSGWWVLIEVNSYYSIIEEDIRDSLEVQK